MQFSDNQIGITWYSPSLDGYFRLGMVHMHSDLLKHDDNFHDDLNIGEEMKIEYYEWNIIQIRKMSYFLPQKQDIFLLGIYENECEPLLMILLIFHLYFHFHLYLD